MRKLAQTLTGRLTPDGVRIGTVTYNIVSARVGNHLGRGRHRSLVSRVPSKHFTSPRRITRLTLGLASAPTCVAKRVVKVSKNFV